MTLFAWRMATPLRGAGRHARALRAKLECASRQEVTSMLGMFGSAIARWTPKNCSSNDVGCGFRQQALCKTAWRECQCRIQASGVVVPARRGNDKELLFWKARFDDIQGRSQVTIGCDKHCAVKSVFARINHHARCNVNVCFLFFMLNPSCPARLTRVGLALEVSHDASDANVLKGLYLVDVPSMGVRSPSRISRKIVHLND